MNLLELVGTGIWLGILAFELWAARARPRWTLSEVIRQLLHTRTAIGRTIFLVAWGGFATWFAWHIITEGGP